VLSSVLTLLDWLFELGPSSWWRWQWQ